MVFSNRALAGWAAASGLAILCMAALPAAAQYPGQITDKSKQGQKLRSVVVVEWTGDLTKPKASRVIPVSVFDGQTLQDGGIYLARPQPLALDGEVEYEIEKDGTKAGLFDIHSAAEQGGGLGGGYWIGFGNYKPLPTGPTPEELARRAANQRIDADDTESDQPVLHRKHHADDNTGGAQSKTGSAADPDRPTLHKGGDAGNDSGSSTPGPAPDPDRPRLHTDNDSANTSGSDGDRPKLNKRPDNDEAHVEDLPDVTDPNRPRLKRGKPAGYGGDEAPTLMGLPPEMEQEVAVSDPRPIKDHPWDFTWANPGDEAKMKAAMEDIARKALGLDQPPAPKPAPRKTAGSAHRKTAPPPPPPEPAPLRDEQFRVFELAYGGGATMVLSARTEGAGADQKFVTIVAQPDLYGSAVVLMKSVTDAAHLDVTPRMRLVDAVDAEADNRGELLFELRWQSQRQFALYRVYRGQATQIFVTGAIGTGSSAGE